MIISQSQPLFALVKFSGHDDPDTLDRQVMQVFGWREPSDKLGAFFDNHPVPLFVPVDGARFLRQGERCEILSFWTSYRAAEAALNGSITF